MILARVEAGRSTKSVAYNDRNQPRNGHSSAGHCSRHDAFHARVGELVLSPITGRTLTDQLGHRGWVGSPGLLIVAFTQNRADPRHGGRGTTPA